MKLKEFIDKLSRLDLELDVLVCAEEHYGYGYGARWDEPLFQEDCKGCLHLANVIVTDEAFYIGV